MKTVLKHKKSRNSEKGVQLLEAGILITVFILILSVATPSLTQSLANLKTQQQTAFSLNSSYPKGLLP